MKFQKGRIAPHARVWTAAEDDYIRKHFPDNTAQSVADSLKVHVQQVYRRAKKLGVKKSHEFMESYKSGRMFKGMCRGKAKQYPKGHVPANKGKKMSVELKAKMQHTFFQKGHLPANTLTDGAVTIRKDKRGIPYEFIRVAKGVWIHKKNVVWEQHNGRIPKGHCVRCKDGNTLNSNIENIELITRQENMLRNTIHRYPPELKEVIRLHKKLERKINGKEHNRRPTRPSVQSDSET